MVKFRIRWIKKRYKKKKVYRYKHYSMDFPAKLNEKIDPHHKKAFEVVDFVSKETVRQEFINITLARDKAEQTPNRKDE